MKKALYISAIASLVLAALLLTLISAADAAANDALRRGNRLFEAGAYEDALSAYEAGLSDHTRFKPLYFCAAQAAYRLGAYDKAAEYFDQSEDLLPKYLSAGNILYKVGEATEETEQKAALYAQAIQFYKEGILKFPEDVPLKFNYEFVSKKLSDLMENAQQESSDQSEDGDEQEQESSSEESAEGEQSESETGEQEDGQPSESQEATAQEDGESEADQEAVARVLQMLEEQEEQSLKNNREVANENDGKVGW